MQRRLLPLTLLAALLTVLALGTVAASAERGGGDDTRLSAAQRNQIRAETKQFRDVDAAVAAGYLPTDECVAVDGLGGMGYHYVNPDHVTDGVVDVAKPDVLVYQRAPNGQLRLGAVEYLIFDEDGRPDTDDDRPYLFGRYGFDGPMPGHEPEMPVHYDLHVWLYEHNPAGELQGFNPRVTCPELD